METIHNPISNKLLTVTVMLFWHMENIFVHMKKMPDVPAYVIFLTKKSNKQTGHVL